MGKNRLEAFSDGVIAIIITIMVLELKVPAGASMADLQEVLHQVFSYLLSFVFIGIYWNNHHHLIQAVKQVNGRILWANAHLLFWLSLVPFGTAWLGETHLARDPAIFYGILLTGAAVAYFILARSLVKHHGHESPIAKALGADFKGKISIVMYLVGIGLSFAHSYLAIAVYVLVAMMWLVPDRRIERILAGQGD
jgi:uncharacterized membrane protein